MNSTLLLKDQQTDTVWLRYNGNTAPFTNWHSREPNERGIYECAFGIWHVAGGKWYTKSCDIDTDIVCERPFGTTTTTLPGIPGCIPTTSYLALDTFF